MSIKDAFKVFVKIFHRNGTEFMEDTPHFNPVVGVGVTSILGGHQQTVILLAGLV
jgi:hypothetical protein